MIFKAFAIFSFIFISAVQSGPSDEMYEKLKNAKGEREVAMAEADILSAWMDSGSPTVDLLMSRANDAIAAGDTEHARALYDRCILIKPDYPEAWNRRAALFLADDKFDEALRDINEVLTLEPRHFGASGGLGAVLERLGSKDEAISAYEKALEIYPLFPSAKRGISRIRREQEGRPVSKCC